MFSLYTSKHLQIDFFVYITGIIAYHIMGVLVFVSEYKAFPCVYQLRLSGCKLEKQPLGNLTKRKFIGRLFGSSQDQCGG